MRKIFTSRWSALIWAGGIVWTAVDIADSQPHAPPSANANGATAVMTDADGDPVSTDDINTLAGFLNRQ